MKGKNGLLVDKIVINIFYSNGKLLRIDLPKRLIVFVFLLILIIPFTVAYVFNQEFQPKQASVVKKSQITTVSTYSDSSLKPVEASTLPKVVTKNVPQEIKGEFLINNLKIKKLRGNIFINFLLGHKNVSENKHRGLIKVIQLNDQMQVVDSKEDNFSFRRARKNSFKFENFQSSHFYMQIFINKKLVQNTPLL